jgi:hypothetical protein
VYTGAPDDETRKKVRTALSFALGVYLVETGHTLYDPTWLIVRATSISPYSLDGRALDLPIMPLTWLTDRNYQFDISRQKLQRMMEKLVSAYHTLDLGNLAWAYWHARTAAVHIAPAHFGAAIEALQRAYVKMNPGKIRTKILPDAQWDDLFAALGNTINFASLSEEDKTVLTWKIRSGTNSAPERAPKGHLASARHHHWRRRGRSMEATGSSRSWPANSGRQGASSYPGHEATDRPFPSSALEHKRCRRLIY